MNEIAADHVAADCTVCLDENMGSIVYYNSIAVFPNIHNFFGKLLAETVSTAKIWSNIIRLNIYVK